MKEHKTPISKIMSIALKYLKKTNPKIKLVVSFADQNQGHHGGIYQAGNWIYNGCSSAAKFYMINGKLTHPRTLGSRKLKQSIEGARKIDPMAQSKLIPGKHRYLMPLDDEMRKRILPLAKPYPKRVKDQEPTSPVGLGGETPTHTLQHSEASHASR